MNKNIAKTTLIIAAVVASSQQIASAQQDGGTGARYQFAPNTWHGKDAERATYTNMSPQPTHPLVPRNLLGIPSAQDLTPAAPRSLQQVAPIAQPLTHVATSFASAVPQAIPSSAPTAPLKPLLPPSGLKAEFGKPITPVIASRPQPQAATAKPAPGKSNAAKPNSKPVRVASHSLSGRMIHPHLPIGRAAEPAQSLQPIASYGSQGYDPGPLLPHVSQGGQGANTKLSGKIMHH